MINRVVLFLITASGAFRVWAFLLESIFAEEILTSAVPVAFVLNVSVTTAVETALSAP